MAAPLRLGLNPLDQLITTANDDPPTAASLKLVKTIVKNLVEHAGDEKYTSIKLSGKAGMKLVAAPAALSYLTSLGFATSEDGETLAIEPANALAVGSASPTAAAHLAAANATLVQVAVPGGAAAPPPALAQASASSNGGSGGGGGDPMAGLSLKQKARRQKELDEAKKRDDAKRLKAAELAKIKQDNYVRKNDENWKSAAAGVKGGKSIDTFRGQFGEDSGGG